MTLLHIWIKRIAIGLIVLMALGAVVQIVIALCYILHLNRYVDIDRNLIYLLPVGTAVVICTILLLISIVGLVVVIWEDRNRLRACWLCAVWFIAIVLVNQLFATLIQRKAFVMGVSTAVEHQWSFEYERQSLEMMRIQTIRPVPTRQPPITKRNLIEDTEPTVPDGWPESYNTSKPPAILQTSDLFDRMHSEFECCGYNGKKDFKERFKEQLPRSCCPGSPSKCLEADAYPRGCAEPIQAIINSYFLGLISMYGILSFLTIAAGIFSCILLCGPPDDDDDDDD